MSAPLKPGWKMTVPQWAHYFKLFGQVCAKHKIAPKNREAFRKETHRKVFGAPISAKDIDHMEMFGKIKNHFLFLLDNVKGTMETLPDGQFEDAKRRLLNHIRGYQFALLRALGVDGEQYIKPILRNRWKASTLEDLSAERPVDDGGNSYASPLEKLRFDIQRAIQSKREDRGWTVHQLHRAAGLPCPHDCTQCEAAAMSTMSTPSTPSTTVLDFIKTI